ncbi:MAG: hypothetical protein R2684_13010 [Pyrinomonadaceae bacterium]
MKIKTGDIFELKTDIGLFYLQYIGKREDGIEFVRVFDGPFSERPDIIATLADNGERFFIQLPISASVRRGMFERVGENTEQVPGIPKFMRDTPVMPGQTGWDIVDTKTCKRKHVEELTAEEVALSPWEWWNHATLKHSLEEGWRLENWV